MPSAYIERHIRTLSLAHACVQFGARLRTTSYVTGMPYFELYKFYPPGEGVFRAGRLPTSPEWIMGKTNYLERAELSMFAAMFNRIQAQHGAPGDSLVTAYRLYLDGCAGHPRVSFDRAFDVVCRLKGIWAHSTASVALAPCRQCGSLNLTSMGDHASQHHGCTFCRLLSRYDKDSRIRDAFPKRRSEQGPLSHASVVSRILTNSQ